MAAGYRYQPCRQVLPCREGCAYQPHLPLLALRDATPPETLVFDLIDGRRRTPEFLRNVERGAGG
jgi:hypothetical protein